jgi:hypothetical protein
MTSRFSTATRPALIFLLGLLTVAGISCRKVAPGPESLAKSLAEQIRDADPKGAGVFFEGQEHPAEDQLIITYRISRQDDQDDVWDRQRMVHFIFLPAPDDPHSVGGWYLERMAGDYLEYLGVAQGLQFDWDYQSYQSTAGSGHGIIGLAGTKSVR